MKSKHIVSIIPEIYLICTTIYYWFLTGTLFNPVAIILLCIFIYQTLYKKNILGLIISILFILFNLYMFLALFSELSEFNEINEDYKKLLIFGSIYLGLNILVSSIMFWKYLKKQTQLNDKTVSIND